MWKPISVLEGDFGCCFVSRVICYYKSEGVLGISRSAFTQRFAIALPFLSILQPGIICKENQSLWRCFSQSCWALNLVLSKLPGKILSLSILQTFHKDINCCKSAVAAGLHPACSIRTRAHTDTWQSHLQMGPHSLPSPSFTCTAPATEVLPVVTQRVTGKDRTVFQAFHFLCHLGTPTEGKGHMVPALPSLCCFQTQESLTVGIHPHCCYLDWNWWVLRIQEAVMVPFTILGGEEICWRNWQILRGEKKKFRKTISVKKPMFVC